MQTKTRLLHFLLVLVMGFFGAIALVAYEFFQYEEPQADIRLPEKAEWAVRVDVEQLAKNEAYTLLFRAKDESLIRTLREMLDERIEKSQDKGPLTIDFRQDIMLFGFRANNRADKRRYVGLRFEVVDPERFRNNIGNHIGKGYYAQVNGTTALVLFSPDITRPDGATEKEMLELASNLLKERRVWKAPAFERNAPFLSVETQAFAGATDGKLTMDCFQEDHALFMEGTFASEETPVYANYSLRSSGLFVSTSIIPAGLSDSIAKLLPVRNVRIPTLRALTLDYQGTVVDNSSGGMLVLPQMNLVLEAQTVFSADSIWAMVPPEMQGEGRTIVIGTARYQLKQLDEKTVFIGLDSKAVTKQKATDLCTVKGSLHHLTKISSNSYIVAFMDMIPAVKAGKDFVAKTKSIDFSVTRKNGNNYGVRGRIEFTDDAYAINECLRLALAMDLFQ